MPTGELPGSFRDPSGCLFDRDGQIFRFVSARYRGDYDLAEGSGFFAAAMKEGLLLPHREVEASELPDVEGAYRLLLPEQLRFVSYPFEWCFSQLRDAALLTLRLQRRALDFDLSLKDASAYNVQFPAGKPIFIDTLSFEAYREGEPWVAYRQFCQHFLAPLVLMSRVHVDLGRLLRVHIDGVPLDVASALLPWTTRLRFSLLSHVHLHARAQRVYADSAADSADGAKRLPGARVSRTGLLGLLDSLETTVRKLKWAAEGTEWADYYEDTNYSSRAHEHKMQLVGEFLDDSSPGDVWDLGANQGLFSRIASDRGIPTVAFDVDPAAVDQNYRAVRQKGEAHLLPLVQDLTNPSAAMGWDHRERMSLEDRGPAGLVLALALVHHLAIGNNVPLPRIAEMLQRLGERLVIEFVPKHDSQVKRLLATREDVFPNYTQEGFEAAFLARYELLRKIEIEDSERTLYLLARKGPPG